MFSNDRLIWQYGVDWLVWYCGSWGLEGLRVIHLNLFDRFMNYYVSFELATIWVWAGLAIDDVLNLLLSLVLLLSQERIPSRCLLTLLYLTVDCNPISVDVPGAHVSNFSSTRDIAYILLCEVMIGIAIIKCWRIFSCNLPFAQLWSLADFTRMWFRKHWFKLFRIGHNGWLFMDFWFCCQLSILSHFLFCERFPGSRAALLLVNCLRRLLAWRNFKTFHVKNL